MFVALLTGAAVTSPPFEAVQASHAPGHSNEHALFTRIHVTDDPPLSTYEVQALHPVGLPIDFEWTLATSDCDHDDGAFSSSGNTAWWVHNGPDCDHSSFQHHGTVMVQMTADTLVDTQTHAEGSVEGPNARKTTDVGIAFAGGDRATPGNAATHRFALTEEGPDDATVIQAVILFPAEFSIQSVGSGDPCSTRPGAVECVTTGPAVISVTGVWSETGPYSVRSTTLSENLDPQLANNVQTSEIVVDNGLAPLPPGMGRFEVDLICGSSVPECDDWDHVEVGLGMTPIFGQTGETQEAAISGSTAIDVPEGTTLTTVSPGPDLAISGFGEESACQTPVCVVEVQDEVLLILSLEQSSASADLAVQIRPDFILTDNGQTEVRLSVSNNGPSTATGITAVVQWEGSVQIGDLDNECTLMADGGAAVCQLGTVPAGSIVSRTVGMASHTGAAPLEEYHLEATVRGNQHDPHLDNNLHSFLGRVHASLKPASGDDPFRPDVAIRNVDCESTCTPVPTAGSGVSPVASSRMIEFMQQVLSFTNDGAETATDTSVTLRFPSSLHVVPVDATCEREPPVPDTMEESLSCYVGDIPIGDFVEMEVLAYAFGFASSTIAVEVAGVEPDADIIDNTIMVPMIAEPPGGAPVAEDGVALPDIVVTKTPGHAFALSGETLNFTIVVSNEGDAGATGILVEDIAVFDHSPLAVTSTGATCSLAGDRISCLIDALAPGDEVVIHVSMEVGSVPDPVVVNRAIAVANEPEENLTNNLALAWLTAFQASTAPAEPTGDEEETPPTADLAVTKVDLADPVHAGDSIEYEITVKNNGPSDATGVILVDRMLRDHTGATQERLPVEWFVGRGCNRPTLTCLIGDLAAGDSITVSLKLKPLGHELVLNTAIVSGNEIDPFPSNDRDEEWTLSLPTPEPLDCRPRGCALLGPQHEADADPGDDTPPDPDPDALSADISVDVVGPLSPVFLEEPYWYTVSVTNLGPDEATDVILRNHLPWEANLDSFIRPIGGVCVYGGFHEIDCELGDMAPGASADLLVRVVPWLDGLLWTRGSAFAAEPDPDLSDNVVWDSTRVVSPPRNGTADLNLSKVASGQRLAAGENVTFMLNVTNEGPDVARDVVLQDILPAGFHVLEATTTQGLCSRTGICVLGNISVNETVFVNLTGFATNGSAKDLVNPAYAKASTTDPDTSNNVARASLVVDRANVTAATATTTIADVAVTVVSPQVVRPGATVAHKIVVTNEGPASASGVGLLVAAPSGLQFGSLMVPDGTTCEAHLTSCLIGDLSAGSEVSFVLTYRVPTGTAAGDVVTTATVLANEADADLADNTVSSTSTITPARGGGGGDPAASGPSSDGTGPGTGSGGRAIAQAGSGQRTEGPNGQGHTRFSANVDTRSGTRSLQVSFPEGSPLLDLSMGIRDAGGPVQVEVTVHDGPPDGVSGLPAGVRPSALYLDISVNGATAEGGSFSLSVPRAYLEEQGIEQVFVLHFDGTAWVEVAAVVVSEDAEQVVLRVTTPSFSPFVVVRDEAPPSITGVSPQGRVDDGVVILGADWSDNRGVDASSVKVAVDGVEVSVQADASGFRHTLDLDRPSPGVHTVTVRVADISGLTAEEEWTFETASAAPVEEKEASPGGGVLLTVALLGGVLALGRTRRRR